MVDPSFFSFLRDLHTDNPFKSVKLGDEKADAREKFQLYPTVNSRHRNLAKLLGNVENLNFRKWKVTRAFSPQQLAIINEKPYKVIFTMVDIAYNGENGDAHKRSKF